MIDVICFVIVFSPVLALLAVPFMWLMEQSDSARASNE